MHIQLKDDGPLHPLGRPGPSPFEGHLDLDTLIAFDSRFELEFELEFKLEFKLEFEVELELEFEVEFE